MTENTGGIAEPTTEQLKAALQAQLKASAMERKLKTIQRQRAAGEAELADYLGKPASPNTSIRLDPSVVDAAVAIFPDHTVSQLARMGLRDMVKRTSLARQDRAEQAWIERHPEPDGERHLPWNSWVAGRADARDGAFAPEVRKLLELAGCMHH